MNRWWSFLGALAAGTLGGSLGAYVVATRVADRELDEGSFWYAMSMADAQHYARVPLYTLRAASRGDLDSVIKFNCRALKIEARRLHWLVDADRDRKLLDPDLKIVYEKSAETIKALELKNQCPGRSWQSLIGEEAPVADAQNR